MRGATCTYAHGEHELECAGEEKLETSSRCTDAVKQKAALLLSSLLQPNVPAFSTKEQPPREGLAQPSLSAFSTTEQSPRGDVAQPNSSASGCSQALPTGDSSLTDVQIAVQDFNADEYNGTGAGTYIHVEKSVTRLEKLLDDANDADWQLARCDSGLIGWVPSYCFAQEAKNWEVVMGETSSQEAGCGMVDISSTRSWQKV